MLLLRPILIFLYEEGKIGIAISPDKLGLRPDPTLIGRFWGGDKWVWCGGGAGAGGEIPTCHGFESDADLVH